MGSSKKKAPKKESKKASKEPAASASTSSASKADFRDDRLKVMKEERNQPLLLFLVSFMVVVTIYFAKKMGKGTFIPPPSGGSDRLLMEEEGMLGGGGGGGGVWATLPAVGDDEFWFTEAEFIQARRRGERYLDRDTGTVLKRWSQVDAIAKKAGGANNGTAEPESEDDEFARGPAVKLLHAPNPGKYGPHFIWPSNEIGHKVTLSGADIDLPTEKPGQPASQPASQSIGSRGRRLLLLLRLEGRRRPYPTLLPRPPPFTHGHTHRQPPTRSRLGDDQ